MTTDLGEQEMANWGRLLLDGIPFADMIAATGRADGVSWFEHWMKRADEYEAMADVALGGDHPLTAGYYLWVGSLCAQYAQFLWFDDTRALGQKRKAELYVRAAPLLSPPAQRFELEFAGTKITGYLRLLPELRGPQPVVLLLGGLESTKEESLLFEDLLLERGMATCTFDGPGQGEMFADVPLSDDYFRYTSRVVDELVADTRVDSDRIGLLGRSLGGYYALEAACHDHRFVCSVSWGGFVDMESWDLETPLTKESWKYVSKVDSMEEAEAHVRRCIDTRPGLSKTACPTLFLHGALDEVPLSQVDVVRGLIGEDLLTIVVEMDGDHCCHNLGPGPRLMMADWIADHVLA